MLGGPEIIIIILAVVVLLFGAKKIPEFARNLGRAQAEFKRGKLMVEKEIRDADYEDKDESTSGKKPKSSKKKSKSKIIRTAKNLGIDTEGKSEEELKKEIAEHLE